MTTKYEPFWQEVRLESLILMWLLRPLGLIFNLLTTLMTFTSAKFSAFNSVDVILDLWRHSCQLTCPTRRTITGSGSQTPRPPGPTSGSAGFRSPTVTGSNPTQVRIVCPSGGTFVQTLRDFILASNLQWLKWYVYHWQAFICLFLTCNDYNMSIYLSGFEDEMSIFVFVSNVYLTGTQ